MFKKFLMENAHRENVKNLFRWWNGQVFSFETVPGTNRGGDDGFDSGMEEAEAALRSDDEFSGGDDEEFGGSVENFDDNNNISYGPVAESRTDLAANLMQLTVSEPSDPVLAHAIAVPWVREREPTLGDSDGSSVIMDVQTV